MSTMSEQPLDPDFLDRALMTPIRLATEAATASSGAFMPRFLRSRSSSAQLSVDSR